MRIHRYAATVLCATVAATVVAGCSPLNALADPATVIPEALTAANLGTVDTYAATQKDGFSDNLFVQVEYDRCELTTTDLIEALTVIVDNDQGAQYTRLRLVATCNGDLLDGTEIDLASLALELGFKESQRDTDISFIQKMDLTDAIVDAHR